MSVKEAEIPPELRQFIERMEARKVAIAKTLDSVLKRHQLSGSRIPQPDLVLDFLIERMAGIEVMLEQNGGHVEQLIDKVDMLARRLQTLSASEPDNAQPKEKPMAAVMHKFSTLLMDDILAKPASAERNQIVDRIKNGGYDNFWTTGPAQTSLIQDLTSAGFTDLVSKVQNNAYSSGAVGAGGVGTASAK